MTVFVVAIMIGLRPDADGPELLLWPAGQPTTTVTTTGGPAAATVATAGIRLWLGYSSADCTADIHEPERVALQFYAAEDKRQTKFPGRAACRCSRSSCWSLTSVSVLGDVDAAGLMSHPLWSHFDIQFKDFNSATSYSCPAAIRLRAPAADSLPHKNLYQPAANQCYLFDNLAKLGFTQHLMMGHNGQFG
ncbi:cellulose biosynthesis protein BcsG [Enterobacter hormaechei]